MQKLRKSFNQLDLLLFFLGFGLLIYTFLRAHLLSMTCDEASTYFTHVPNSVWKCFVSESCWDDANNHLLNTFLMQVSITVFGVGEWTLRLPNLIGHLFYLIFSFLIVKRYAQSLWIALAGFCLLNFNPFLLEFFSLARGYGLGVGMMMVSIYFLLRWIEDQKWKSGMYCYVFAILAVLSNFVFLNYWASLSAVFVFFILINLKFQHFLSPPLEGAGGRSFSQTGKNIGEFHPLTPASGGEISEKGQSARFEKWQAFIPFGSAILLFFLLKNPIHFLSSEGEFVYGHESFWESYIDMVRASVMSQGYFDPITTKTFLTFSITFLLTSIGLGIYYFFKKIETPFSKIHFALVSLMILICLSTIVQYHLLDVKYLQGRKGTVLIPIFGLVGYACLQSASLLQVKKGVNIIAILITLFSFNHFYRTFDLKESIEWRYDAYTKDMIMYLNNTFPKEQKIKLGVYYNYEPASHFYQEQLNFENLELFRLNKEEFSTAKEFDFIYLEIYQMELLSDLYILEKRFKDSGALFRKIK